MVIGAIGVGATIWQVIQWIIDHPEEIAAGEKAVLDAIRRVMDVWDAYQAGTKTHAELLAEWAQDGIDIKKVEDHWLKKHPLDPPTV